MNGKCLILLALGLFLAGCVTPPANPDLYTNMQSSQLTAAAAQDLAHYQAQALTATAEAPIIRITETAAGMVFQQQAWTATAQSVQSTETAAMTQTAQAWTPTVNATQTAVYVQSVAQATRIANDTERNNLELRRQQIANEFWAIVPGIAFALVAGVLLVAVVVAVRTTRFRPMAVDPRGNVIPVMDIVDGTVTDMDRNPNYRGLLSDNLFKQWVTQKLKLPPLLPAITAARQDAATERDQMIDLATRGLPGPEGKERGKIAGQIAGQQMKLLTGPTAESRFTIFDGEAGPLQIVEGVITQELDNAWKESKKE